MRKSISVKSNMLTYILACLLIMPVSELEAQNGTSYHIKNGLFSNENYIKIKSNGTSFNIKYEGDFTLSNDDKDVLTISEGGFLEITRSSFGNKRRILIESNEGAKLSRKYYSGSKEKDYVPEGKTWLAEILPELVRTTTFAAKSRVDRFYKNGGVDAVLGEVQRMESDYVRSAYFGELIKKGLSDTELTRTIQQSGELLKSDYYLSELLTRYQGAFVDMDKALNAYIKASANISSDYYKAKVLEQVVKNQSIEDQKMGQLLDISQKIKSDYYLTSVFMEILAHRELNEANTAKLLSLAEYIDSDHYKTEVLKDVIKKEDINAEAYKALIGTMNDVQSDHYLGEVIKELWARKMDIDNGELNELLQLVNRHLQSDYYIANFYKSLSRRELSEQQLKLILESISTIQSDYYLSETLQLFSGQVRNSSEEIKSAYRRAMKSIDSSTYYGRAAKAID